MSHPMEYLHHSSFGIGALGVLVIVFGVACGLVRFVRAEFRAARGCDVDEDRKRLRHVLGYYLLLGLEFLIAADIIDTLMKPSVQDRTADKAERIARHRPRMIGCVANIRRIVRVIVVAPMEVAA